MIDKLPSSKDFEKRADNAAKSDAWRDEIFEEAARKEENAREWADKQREKVLAKKGRGYVGERKKGESVSLLPFLP
jgi:hypothetical protein